MLTVFVTAMSLISSGFLPALIAACDIFLYMLLMFSRKAVSVIVTPSPSKPSNGVDINAYKCIIFDDVKARYYRSGRRSQILFQE